MPNSDVGEKPVDGERNKRAEPGRQTCISMSLLGRTVPSLALEKLSVSVVHMLKLDMTSTVISF